MYEVQQYTVAPEVDREVHLIAHTGTVTGGTFRMRFGDEWTDYDDGKDWSDDKDVVCNRIKALGQALGTGNLSCSADAY